MNFTKEELREIRTRIDEIMFYKWDSLSLSNSTWARDEYRSYVPEVIRLAFESTSYHPIADYLTQVNVEEMGMEDTEEHDIKIAKLIFALANDELYMPDHTSFEV